MKTLAEIASTVPNLRPVKPGLWQLINPCRIRGFVVAAGFQTDLDTVPRLPLLYTIFKGRTVRAAILHDWLLYSGFPRSYADKMFLAEMRVERVPFYYRYPIFWAVRLHSGWITLKNIVSPWS